MKNMKKIGKFSLRVILFLLGMFVSCYGIAITTRGGMGTSPICTPAYAPDVFKVMTFGTAVFIMNTIFLIGQICILRKEFKIVQLVQLPVAFLTGVFTDLSMYLTQFIHSSNYFLNIFYVVLGSAILGLGLALELYPKLTYMPGDGFVNVLFEKTKWNFSKIKISFDVTLVIISLLMCVLFLHGHTSVHLNSIRMVVGEGTLISALTVGIFADMFLKLMKYKAD